MHADLSFNETWGVYWASMPGPDEILVAELFNKEQLDMLQHPALVSANRANFYVNWHSNHLFASVPILLQVAAATNRQKNASTVFANVTNKIGFSPYVSLEAYNYAVALVRTRAFSPLRSAHINWSYFLPLVDLLNHSFRSNVKIIGRMTELLNLFIKILMHQFCGVPIAVYEGVFYAIASKSLRKGQVRARRHADVANPTQ